MKTRAIKLTAAEIEAKAKRRIREANRRFAKLDDYQKRLVIANDVLSQIGKKIKAEYGYWTQFDSRPEDGYGKLAYTPQFAGDEPCEACALGALFACTVRRADGLRLAGTETEIIDDDGRFKKKAWGFDFKQFKPYLEQYFEPSQLEMIEIAFERGKGWFVHSETPNLPQETIDRCVGFAKVLSRPADRMRAIFQNIVWNGGTFVP